MTIEYKMLHCILDDGTELKLGDFVSLPNYKNIGYRSLEFAPPRIIGVVTRFDYFDVRNEYHIYINDENEYYTDNDILQAFRLNDYCLLEEIYNGR